MDKIKSWDFTNPPPLPFSLMPPYPNDTPKFHLIIKRCVKDDEMITWKEAFGAVYWGKKQKQQQQQKKHCFQNILGGLQQATTPLQRMRVNDSMRETDSHILM